MDGFNKQRALKTALDAAQAGADIIMEGFGRKPAVRHKGATDLVTEYDLKSEEAVKKIIGRAYPDHQLVGEEEGAAGRGRSDYTWYIDPIDGTTNFAHGHPFFAVSIGLSGPGPDGRSRPLVGVINAPVLGELYWGTDGGGAFRRRSLPGRGLVEGRLAVSDTGDLREAVLNTGFPYDIYERGDEVLHPFGRLVMAARAVRRAGAASLDIAYVAAGLADAFWESNLKPWDVAAALLLLTEAGGEVSDYQGRPLSLDDCEKIVGSNGRLHQAMLEYLR
ncbi:inositol monophosphatase [Deltaproteobacteria bacterium OttesenSCG-928-M10]|nr:inositol monophosphatase [Deltaproteobacteria bacterium OttesenSCG-928-M10]